MWKNNYSLTKSPKYGRVLNMRALHSVLNIPEYALRVLSTSGFWICKELHMVLDMPQHGSIYLSRTRICLNMSEFTLMAARHRGFIYSRTYEKSKLEKISQFSKGATFLDFIYWFYRVFGKLRQRISTQNHVFSILLNWERYYLRHIFLTVHTLEEVRR